MYKFGRVVCKLVEKGVPMTPLFEIHVVFTQRAYSARIFETWRWRDLFSVEEQGEETEVSEEILN
jgi:hypothetical protein